MFLENTIPVFAAAAAAATQLQITNVSMHACNTLFNFNKLQCIKNHNQQLLMNW